MTIQNITSRKNEKIIFAASLKDKKNRDENSLFFVEGRKLFFEALSCALNLRYLFFTERAKNTVEEIVERTGAKISEAYLVSDEVYSKISAENSPEGIFAVFEKFESFTSKDISCGGFVVLENIQNPSNLGTIIRSACALGVENILLSKSCADIYGSKTCRAAMGALFRTKIFVSDDICESIKTLSAYGRVFGAALCDGATDVSDAHFTENDSIVIGNEGAGISQEALACCTHTVIIPMHNGTESLNAASAATILIWEMSKQGKNKA